MLARVIPEFLALFILACQGCGCVSAIERNPFNQEVVGMNPARYFTFSLSLYLLSCASLNRSLVRVQHS